MCGVKGRICSVIQVQLNQLAQENVHMITSLPMKRYQSNKHFVRVIPTRWRRKPAGVDMERNYCVTVAVCIPRYTL